MNSHGASQISLMIKESTCQCDIRGIRDEGSVPELGRSSSGGNGTPLQYSCLENPTDRGAWWTTVHVVTKSQIELSV